MVTNQLTNLIEDCGKTQGGIIYLLIYINHGLLNTNILRPGQLKSQMSISKIKNWNRVKRGLYALNR